VAKPLKYSGKQGHYYKIASLPIDFRNGIQTKYQHSAQIDLTMRHIMCDHRPYRCS